MEDSSFCLYRLDVKGSEACRRKKRSHQMFRIFYRQQQNNIPQNLADEPELHHTTFSF